MLSTRPRFSRFRSPTRVAVGVLILAVIVVGVWWLMLGHDHTYQYDADGTASGPYEALQVLLFIVAMALVTFAAGLLLPAWAVASTVTVALTAAWSIQASSNDLTGLWAVGAIGVLVGTAIGSGLVAFAGHVVGSGHPRRTGDPAWPSHLLPPTQTRL